MTAKRRSVWARILATALGLLIFVAAGAVGAPNAAASSPDVIISQVYGGGGNSGATYTHDFIELFNRGAAPVNVTGWTVQYASSSGSSWQKTALSGTIQPGQYYLVQEAKGNGGTTPLPAPDATGSIAMSATAGKVALVSNANTLTGTCPTGVVDFVGFGGANCSEAAPTAPLSNTTAAIRTDVCLDNDNNGAEFSVGAPVPHNSASPLAPCGGQPTDTAPSVAAVTPTGPDPVEPDDALISVTFSEPVSTEGGWYSLVCSISGAHTATVDGGPTTYTMTATGLVSGDDCTVTVVAASVTDLDTDDPPDAMAANYSWSFHVQALVYTYIHDIQGAGHISPMAGQPVTNVPGIVTGLKNNGFFMQDPNPDGSDATSEGIFVFTSSAPTVRPGDKVLVKGTVSEYRPGAEGLTITELTRPTFTKKSGGNPLPAPTVVGQGGRMPPMVTIEDDAAGNAESSNLFDPENDGLDYWESLEAMLVQLNVAVAVGPTQTRYGELPVVADNGEGAMVASVRGGVVATLETFNPQRIIVDDLISGVTTPAANVGDHFAAPLVGAVDYAFDNYHLALLATPTVVPGGLSRETTTPAGLDQLSIGTFNVENLDPGDGAAKFATLAGMIVHNLQAPDIVAVEEIQDNNGEADTGNVDATQTWTMLVGAIQAAGGPTYEYRQVNPENKTDGGAPGGNIRVGFLFRTDRGLAFVDKPGATASTANEVVNGPDGPELLYSPGRIDPTNPAFDDSRKPLAGEFMWNGNRLFVVANHFNSKGGDEPLFGVNQPPVRVTEAQRMQQAMVVNQFVGQILAADPNALVAVVGDMNDFEYSAAMTALRGSILYDPIETLAPGERYTYVFEGNSQALDHIMISRNLFENAAFDYDIVHVNSEFANQASDHEPQVIKLTLPKVEGSSVTGGGWVAGAGKAKVSFSVSARLKKDETVPKGQVVVNYAEAGVNFHSTELSWLGVIGSQATVEGAGTVNGEGDYGVKITVTAARGGDTVEIRIWDRATGTVVFETAGPEAVHGSVQVVN